MVWKVCTKPYTWCTKWSIWPQILANESSTSFNISNAISLSNTFPHLERNSFFCRLWNLFVFFISLPFSIDYDLEKCSYHFICVWLYDIWFPSYYFALISTFHIFEKFMKFSDHWFIDLSSSLHFSLAIDMPTHYCYHILYVIHFLLFPFCFWMMYRHHYSYIFIFRTSSVAHKKKHH